MLFFMVVFNQKNPQQQQTKTNPKITHKKPPNPLNSEVGTLSIDAICQVAQFWGWNCKF